jgi:hypothetical protein
VAMSATARLTENAPISITLLLSSWGDCEP